jgi:chemotaxis family two-component system response regulator Rcp1
MTSDLRVVEILLVEDNETDVLIAREALKEARVVNSLHVVNNGEDAMSFLLREPPYADAPRPDMVLLDWNLPRKNGQEVLAEIKRSETLKRIPVVVLTTSKSEEDIFKAYGLHANCYVTKPLDFKAFQQALRALEDFWLCVVTLPQRNP